MSKIAFLFPGQGAQKAGMGKDFYTSCPEAAEVYDKASEILGLDMKALCFEQNDKLDLTEYTQAALVTTCLAMKRIVVNAGITPDVTAGLSLGEYCAIETAGGMSEWEAIRTVRARGILMQNTVPAGKGAMAAVLMLDAAKIEEVLKDIDGAWIANYNCPGQIVITGTAEGVQAATEPLKAAGAKRVLPLNVSGPFHSPLLVPAGEPLMAELEKVDFRDLTIPYYTNVTGEAVTDVTKTPELLKVQISSSVRWQQSMEQMLRDGVDTFIEIGPGKTLAGFLKKIDRSVKVYSIGNLEELEAVKEALK